MTTARVATTIATALLVASCTAEDRRLQVDSNTATTVHPPDEGISPVLVKESGASVVGRKVTLAFALRNPTPSDLWGIEVRVRLLGASGDEIASLLEELPFCPARTTCWWGALFSGADLGRGFRRIEDIDVSVQGDHDRRPPRDRAIAFRVRRNRQGAVRGTAPRREGMAAVIGFADGGPRSGIAVNIKKGMGFGTHVDIPASIFPRVPGEDGLRAFMYPMSVPQG